MDEFKTDEAVKSNATENAIETKLVEPEEELYKPYKTNSIECRIETKNIKPKTKKKLNHLSLKKSLILKLMQKIIASNKKMWSKKYKSLTPEKQEDVGVVYSVRINQSMDSEAQT